jgi:hypothetical protein
MIDANKDFIRKITRTITHDRRRSAVHEAGHAVLAEHLGVGAVAEIIPTFADDLMNKKAWIGRCYFLSKLSKEQARIIAVAGATAEGCWFNQYLGPWDIEWEDPEVMSASDWRYSGCAIGEPDRLFRRAAFKVFELLQQDGGSLWPLLVRQSRKIITNSRLVEKAA